MPLLSPKCILAGIPPHLSVRYEALLWLQLLPLTQEPLLEEEDSLGWRQASNMPQRGVSGSRHI